MDNNGLTECEALVREFSKGALVWYGFKKNSSILYLYSGKEDAAVREFLETKGNVTAADTDIFTNKNDNGVNTGVQDNNVNIHDINTGVHGVNAGVHAGITYDYIIGIDILEVCTDTQSLLTACHSLLKPDGHLILGTENRYAIKYICGDRDPYTEHSFDGIENYRRLSAADRTSIAGRCYSQAELLKMLEETGFTSHKCYSVMPSLQETQLVYAEGYVPSEELAIRYFPLYNNPDSVFLDEQYLYTGLIENGLFHKMANAYIIECSMDGSFDDTLHATLSLDRGPANALVTSISVHGGIKTVSKTAIYPEGVEKVNSFVEKFGYLKKHGVKVVDYEISDGCFSMPFYDIPVATNGLRALGKKDKTAFIKAMDAMRDIIFGSSEYTEELPEKDRNSANGRDVGPVLKRGYIDMVPLNCFFDEKQPDMKDSFIYYDQEFYVENCPANAILYRSVSILYDGSDKEFELLIPRSILMDRYGLEECSDMWTRMSSRFTDTLRNQKALSPYYFNKRTDGRIVYTNREKINYSAKEYQKIFVDIFEGLDDSSTGGRSKKLILFGSGIFTNKFLEMFADDYQIYSIVDNNSARWGTTMQGIPINPPDIIADIPAEERHIIICIKGYNGVVKQLKAMGVTDYHIYDPGNDYPNKRRENMQKRLAQMKYQPEDNADAPEKPYNVGYIAGVFDLFHIGHLNMFRRAKEQCNYLIVGVVSDEGVRLNKQAEPFVPFEERIEMVRSCRYVDEAVKLPLNSAGTRDMYKIYHFDVQFSGSDYEHDPYWLSEKEFLEKNGSTMVFFPYTQSTSSTKLKKAINAKINKES